ncbi:MAG: hypothetical protein R3Y29_01565 [bacterium]
MEVFPFLAGSIIFVATMQVLLNKNDTGFYTSIDRYMREEREANFVTKNFNDIKLDYIYPQTTYLPFKDYDPSLNTPENKIALLIKRQDYVFRKSNLEMIKLPNNLSNRELKKMVGINNFDKISILETHYNSYVRALYEWALELYNLELFEEAKLVLLEGVRVEGDISDIYILLTNIYNKNNDRSSILALKTQIESFELSLMPKILEHIDNILLNTIFNNKS